MPKHEPKDDFSHIPNVAYVSALELKPNRVIIGLGIAVIVVALGTAGYLIVDKYLLSEVVTVVPRIEVKKKSAATNASTSSARKEETVGWKEYQNDKYTFKFSYPKSWQLAEKTDGEIFNVSLKKASSFINFTINAPGIGLQGAKFETIQVDKTKSTKASIIIDGEMSSIYVLPENKNLLISLSSTEPSTQITKDSIKDFDQILSTFRFD